MGNDIATAREIFLLEQARLARLQTPAAIPSGDDAAYAEKAALLRKIANKELAGQDLDQLRADVRRRADEFVVDHRVGKR